MENKNLAEAFLHHLLDGQKLLPLFHFRGLLLGKDQRSLTSIQVLLGGNPRFEQLRLLLSGFEFSRKTNFQRTSQSCRDPFHSFTISGHWPGARLPMRRVNLACSFRWVELFTTTPVGFVSGFSSSGTSFSSFGEITGGSGISKSDPGDSGKASTAFGEAGSGFTEAALGFEERPARAAGSGSPLASGFSFSVQNSVMRLRKMHFRSGSAAHSFKVVRVANNRSPFSEAITAEADGPNLLFISDREHLYQDNKAKASEKGWV